MRGKGEISGEKGTIRQREEYLEKGEIEGRNIHSGIKKLTE